MLSLIACHEIDRYLNKVKRFMFSFLMLAETEKAAMREFLDSRINFSLNFSWVTDDD